MYLAYAFGVIVVCEHQLVQWECIYFGLGCITEESLRTIKHMAVLVISRRDDLGFLRARIPCDVRTKIDVLTWSALISKQTQDLHCVAEYVITSTWGVPSKSWIHLKEP